MEGLQMKKILSLVLVLSLVIGLMTGCGSNEEATNDDTEQQEATVDMTEEENTSSTSDDNDVNQEKTGVNDFSKSVEISYAKLSDVPPEEDAQVYRKIQEMYNTEFDYINIERSKYNEMLGLKISTGEIPDVFMLDGNMLQYAKFQSQGVLRDIPLDMLEEYAPTYYEQIKKYNQYLLIEGKLYGLSGEKYSNQFPLNAIWRKDWLEAVGIDKIPTSIEEAEEALYAFTNEDPDGNGKNDTYGLGKSGLDMIFGAYGGIPWGPWPQYWLWQEDGNGGLQNAAVMPGMKDALALLQQWYADGVLDPEFVLGENKGGYWAVPTDFVTDKIGFTGLGHYYHWTPPLFEGHAGGSVYQEFKQLNPDAEVAYGKPVVGPEGHSGTWQYPVGVGAAAMWVFGNQTTDEQLIRMLQIMEDQMNNYDNWLLARYGMENEHWIKDEASNAIVQTEEFTNRTDYLRVGIQMLNFADNMEFQANIDPKSSEWAEENYNFPGYQNELMISLPSESKFRPDLEKLRDQYYTEIISGSKPVDAFDEFVEQWNKLGGEQLKQEADEWYKNLEK